MVKGETYNLQLFESEAFRHFINVFTNKESGITLGCQVTKDSQNITISQGYFFIQGGLLRETTGTSNEIPTDAGYYKLVYEIDLSKVNEKDQFNQGCYKFIKSLGNYPDLIQEDLDNGGTIYQLPFCKFRITEQGLQDFEDIRNIIDYGIYEEKKTVISAKTNIINLIIDGNTKVTYSSTNIESTGEKIEFNENLNTFVAKKKCKVTINGNFYFTGINGETYAIINILKNETVIYQTIANGNSKSFVSAASFSDTPEIELNKDDYLYVNIVMSESQSNPSLSNNSYLKISAK